MWYWFAIFVRSLRKRWLVFMRAQNVLTLSRFVLCRELLYTVILFYQLLNLFWCEWGRYLRMHINHQWASSSLMILKGYYYLPFVSLHKLPPAPVQWISENCRLLEYVAIGPRFSNIISQTLMVLLKRLPPKVLHSPFCRFCIFMLDLLIITYSEIISGLVVCRERNFWSLGQQVS